MCIIICLVTPIKLTVESTLLRIWKQQGCVLQNHSPIYIFTWHVEKDGKKLKTPRERCGAFPWNNVAAIEGEIRVVCKDLKPLDKVIKPVIGCTNE